MALPDDDVVALMGGRILTMDDRDTVAAALVARGGRIAAVGTTADLERDLPAHAHRIDLDGRTAVPGFVDGHCHLELTTTHLAYALSCFCPPLGSLDEVARAVAGRAAQTPAGEWVVARSSYALERWVAEGRTLTAADLDPLTPDHPVCVFTGLHSCTLNAVAAAEAGLTTGRDLPPGASWDPATGRATELWDWLPLPRTPVADVAEAVAGLGGSMYQQRGVTSIAELPFTAEGVRAFQQLRREGRLPARLGLWFHLPRFGSIDDIVRLGLEAGFGDEWLAVGGIKLFVDGCGVDAAGAPAFDVKWTQEELDEVVLAAHAGGLQLWLHTTPTIEGAWMALTAIERALERVPRPDHRHRIEHIADRTPDAECLAVLRRMQELGVLAVATPQFVWSYADADPAGAEVPLRTLHAMGIRPPGNSDSTGSQPEAANPFHGIRCAVDRRTRAGTLLAPDEAITVREALRVFTRDAAYACHFDDRGSLEPGKLADVAVLGADPEQVPPGELDRVPVDMTIIGGRVVWSA